MQIRFIGVGLAFASPAVARCESAQLLHSDPVTILVGGNA